MNSQMRLIHDVVLDRWDETSVDSEYDPNESGAQASNRSDKTLADG